MANMFARGKEQYELIKKAQAAQKALKSLEVEATSADGGISITFNGELHITNLKIAEAWVTPEKRRDLEKELTKVLTPAITKAQTVQAEEAKKLMGDLKLPGGLGL